MHVYQNDLGFGLPEQPIRSAEWAIVVHHKDPALQVHHGIRYAAARNALIVSTAGSGCRIVRRTQHTSGETTILHSRLKIVADLLLVPYMIAGCEHVCAKFEEFFADCRRHAKPAGSVLDVDHQ